MQTLRFAKPLFWTVLVLTLAGSHSAAFAQDENQPAPPEEQSDAQDRMGRDSPEMREMARAMKSMADMCEMMMQREMATRPYWIAAVIGVGGLLVIALVLFVILEIQWIRFWGLRIRSERKSLGQL